MGNYPSEAYIARVSQIKETARNDDHRRRSCRNGKVKERERGGNEEEERRANIRNSIAVY